MLFVDTETYDPLLETEGDGSIRRDGKVTCVGLYDSKTKQSSAYRPEDGKLKSILESSNYTVFHNAPYDLAWLDAYGIRLNGTIQDTLVRESIISPSADSYGLDASCRRRGVEGKDFNGVAKWGANNGLKDPIKHMDKVPFEIQAQYCMQDCKATHDLFWKQQQRIDDLELHDVVDLESRLVPVVARMRRNGIRLDEKGRDELRYKYTCDIVEMEDDLVYKSGIVNAKSTKQVEQYFHSEGLVSPFFTEKGSESWDANALRAMNHPIADLLLKVKSKQTVLGTFINGAFQKTVNGRLHTTFYQTNRDEGGTITGRFSSAHPNLQNIPSKEEKGAKDIRGLFLPNEGCRLGAFDYKQIEYRVFAHYVIEFKQKGWRELKEAMERGADYHQFVMDMVGWGPEMRRIAKTLNFGILYGMGKAKCLKYNRGIFIPPAGWTVEEYVDWVYDTYFSKLPFVKPTCAEIVSRGNKLGYVRGLDGRRHVTPTGAAYKIVNYLIQGSAAGLLKKAMVEADEAGIWDVLPLHLTVHDELVFSIPETKAGRDAVAELNHIMTLSDLNVPLGVDQEEGENWGSVA